MAKKEVNTDLWVYDLLKEANIAGKFSAQGSSIKEINEALQTASKRGTGKVGFPEYVGVVKDFLIVIEDKADTVKHLKVNEKEIIAEDITSICDYAANGALFYGKHLSKNTSYKKIIALGISGNEKINKILPKIIKYLKNNNKSTEYNIERRRKSGIYYFDNEGIAIFYQKEFNKKIVEKIDISLPYEDNLNISDIGKILNIEIMKQIL